jgi:glycosyltransferase involved in cell wall biosynthesis
MKIHIDASRALEAQPTGVNIYAREIIEHIIAAARPDAEFILYAPGWSADRAHELFPAAQNIQWKFLPWPPKFLWTQFCLAWGWARAEKKDATAIFFAPAHVAPFFSPRNVIVTIHDVAFEFLPEAFSWRERLFARTMTRVNVRAARAIITPSEETKKQLIARYGAHGEKIFVTPFALPCRSLEKKELCVPREKSAPFILSIGRIEYKKGSDILVRAFEQLRARGSEIELVFVGKPGIGFESIEHDIKKSPYKNFIHVRGFVSDLDGLYAAAHVLALPTRYEGFGFNFLEGMAAGVPVVGMARGSVAEVAGDGAALATTEQEFVELLDQAVNVESFRAKLIARGIEHLKKFSWERTAAQTLEVLLC